MPPSASLDERASSFGRQDAGGVRVRVASLSVRVASRGSVVGRGEFWAIPGFFASLSAGCNSSASVILYKGE